MTGQILAFAWCFCLLCLVIVGIKAGNRVIQNKEDDFNCHTEEKVGNRK